MTVTVVGGGLAGAVAALAAADHRDVPVRLLTAGETSLQGASGLVDVLGYAPGSDGPVVDPFEAIPRLPEEHPYRTVGVEAVRGGLALFDEATGAAYAGGHTERNALVPTALGNLKPTARYPASVAPGVASRETRTVMAGFERFTDFGARLAGARLDDRLPYEVWGTTVDFPAEVAEPHEAPDFAAAFEAAHADDGAEALVEGIHDALARTVIFTDDIDRRVGVPAVLGVGAVADLRARLEATLGTAVFEVPTGPPSVPGRRLEALLREAVQDAGVDVRTGSRVAGAEAENGEITALVVEGDGERAVETETVVLATGGLVGGGVAGDRESVREPVFDCHVAHPEERIGWSDRQALGEHPFARFGVETDGRLRPLDDRGEPEFGNLRAAGSVLGGYDFPAEKSGSGVSIATGYVAGRLAAEDAN